MLKIKLTPTGKKHERHYRIIVAEEHSKLTGTNSGFLGHYHPLTKELKLDKKLYQQWLEKGAQPTEKVRQLAKKA
jgi:small subunit ribosomal protein S16